MKTILLTRGLFAKVDDDDYEWLKLHKWYAAKQPKTWYAARSTVVDGKKSTTWMHREINKTPDGLFTDHKNGEGLDNQKTNLRSATHQDNMINCARHKIGSSQYRGVSWHISNRAWVAQITFNSRNIYVGSFPTEAAAKVAYDIKRAELRAGELIRMD